MSGKLSSPQEFAMHLAKYRCFIILSSIHQDIEIQNKKNGSVTHFHSEQDGAPVLYYKPVQTGFPEDSDTDVVASVCGGRTEFGDHACELLVISEYAHVHTAISNHIKIFPGFKRCYCKLSNDSFLRKMRCGGKD